MSTHAGSRKRRRESHNVDVKIVEIYEDLASENDEVRLKAAQELVSRFTPESQPTEEQIQKSLQRLFRGLCSGRKAARIGFSIALTEVLSQVFSQSGQHPVELSVPKVLEIWESVTDVGNSESGQEQRDHYFGRLFGAEAILKSSILFSSDVPMKEWSRVVTLVVELGKKKPWLREECGWVLYRSICELAPRKDGSKYAEIALQHVCSNELARTAEGVSIWIAVKDLFPDADYPKSVWKYDDPLNVHEKSVLSKAMRGSSVAIDQPENGAAVKGQSGFWKPRLHFAWDVILTRLCDEDSTEKSSNKKSSRSSRIAFRDFWNEVVDDGLFANAASEERKYWGFLVFMKVLNEHSLQVASLVFTKNLIRCFMNQLGAEDRYLHPMAVKASKTILSRASKDPDFAVVAVDSLLGPSGSVNFDKITKSKLVEKIVTATNIAALKRMISIFEDRIAEPDSSEVKGTASGRDILANLLVSIFRNLSPDGDESEIIMDSILSILTRIAYTGDSLNPQVFRNRISSCLNILISNNKNPAKLAYSVVRQIRDLQKANESGKVIIEMDDSIRESVDGAFKSLKRLFKNLQHDEVSQEALIIQAFALLYSMTILQVYNGDADAVSMLDELAFCYSKFWGEKKSKSQGVSDSADASNALVEILLSFASKPSQLFRRMSEQVFNVFADQISADGLQSLISILEVKENLAGQQEMFDQQDDDDEMPDADDSTSDDDSVEVIDPDDLEEEEEESGDDSESHDESDEEDAEEIAAFDAKLAAALGSHLADPNRDDDSSDSDADMNDDEMEAVDEMLVKVFKARSQAVSKKQDKKDAKETMINFKNRVLDLLEIYVKRCHSDILALDLIMALLRLTRQSTSQISLKAKNLLHKYFMLCKGTAIPALDGEDAANQVWDLLRAVHQEARISGPSAHSTSASQASLLLVKILVAHDKENIIKVVDLYGETCKAQLLSNKCHVHPSFFTEWNNWWVNMSNTWKN